MNIAEIIAVVGLLVNAGIVLLGGMYVRGKLDAQIAPLQKMVDDVNDALEALSGRLLEINELAVRTDERVKRHDEECVRRQERIDQGFTRVDQRFDAVMVQINALARDDVRRAAR